MISKIKTDIIDFLSKNPQSSVVRLLNHFAISKQAMHKHLSELTHLDLIEKQGLVPRVFYSIKQKPKPILKYKQDSILDGFLVISPTGAKLEGQEAFIKWCESRNYDFEKYLELYKKTKVKYLQYPKNGLIDATDKIKKTFQSDCYIDKCYYANFSAIEIFGKTGVYAQMLYAKQSGNKKNMLEIFPTIKTKILELIKREKIEAIGYIPPTVSRKIQLMSELEKYVNLNLPKLKIIKIKNQFTVPQKTLSSTIERKINAKDTFVVDTVPISSKILLIDDFVGSGASFNYIAQKIKSKIKCKITCFAIAGTPNGIINNDYKKFEVVQEA
jgi:predicted amidophosphoribosyltransferase